MTYALGTFTLDTADGTLRPALGVVKTSTDPAPPVYDTSAAVGVPSRIESVRHFATAALALAEAEAYRAYIGATTTFRGVTVFVADCEPDHRAARDSQSGEAEATAVWTLVADPGWVPT